MTENNTTIIIRDLKLPCHIGIYAHEEHRPQPVVFNIEMQLTEATPQTADNIENTVSYETVVNDIKALVAKGHIRLVETLAEDVAKICLKDKRVAHTTVAIEKPDIIAEAKGVGVRIVRVRG